MQDANLLVTLRVGAWSCPTGALRGEAKVHYAELDLTGFILILNNR